MGRIMRTAGETTGDPPTNEGIFQATVEMIERQGGLKLLRTKAPIEVRVIDHADRPSVN
jgi:uncharacterized protein (TIGR03435 family)